MKNINLMTIPSLPRLLYNRHTSNAEFRRHLNWADAHWAKDVKTNDKPRYMTFTHPGFPYWCFDVNTYSPTLMSLIGVCEDCWVYGLYQRMPQPLNQTIILSPELRSNGFLLFQTDVELQMRKPMHSKSVQKWPLRAKFGYGCTSGSFLTMYVELRAADKKNL
ncbi:hypothetical protein RRG08_020516 [Elysia crispata]|uniref:Uncharacterized protein n=1 Tax=Elysia crispata TaxID=231223 RepID=A0AAE0YFR1_9GAST|nr:hypothetical protein RRG08_020516 [Elysia crispata]